MNAQPVPCFWCDDAPTARRKVEVRDPGAPLHKSCAAKLSESLGSDVGGGPPITKPRRKAPPRRMARCLPAHP